MNVLRRYAGFRWMWIGQLFSQLGNAVFLVFGLWEIQLRHPILLSVAGLAMTVPSLLSLLGGVLVDSVDPRQLMLMTDAIRGVAVLVGLWLLVFHVSITWVVITLIGIESLGSAVFYPAESAMVPQMVEASHLVEANGLYSLTTQLSSAVGYALGGSALAAVGVGMIFGWDMTSYWLSAFAVVLMMRTVSRPPRGTLFQDEPTTGNGFVASLVEGWRAFRAIPILLHSLPWIVLLNFSFSAGIIMLPFWVHHHLHVGVLWYGIIYGAWAGGMVLGSLLSGTLARVPLKIAFSLAFGAQSALLVGFAASPVAVLSAGLMLLAGMGNGMGNALAMAWMQAIIPSALRGRVFGLIMTLFGIANPLGAVAAGLFLGILPMYWAWVLTAVSGLGFVVALLRFPGPIEGIAALSTKSLQG